MIKEKLVLILMIFIMLISTVGCNAVDEEFNKQYKIKTKINGQGHIRLVPDQDQYQLGDIIKVTAVGEMGDKFKFWGGDLTGNTNPKQLKITKDLVIEANFKATDLPLDPKGILTANSNNSCQTKADVWLKVSQAKTWSQVVSWDLSSVNQISDQAIIKSIQVNNNNLEGRYLHLNIYVFNEAGEGHRVNSLKQLNNEFLGEKVKQNWSVSFNVDKLYSSKVIFLPSLSFQFE